MDYNDWLYFYSQFFCPDCGSFHPPDDGGYGGYPGQQGGYPGQQGGVGGYPPQSNNTTPLPAGRGGPPIYGPSTETADGNTPVTSGLGSLSSPLPPLPPPGPGLLTPLDPSQTFFNNSLHGHLPGSRTHPADEGFPKRLYTRVPDVSSMTAEEQSARAFVLTALEMLNWRAFGEDMHSLLTLTPSPLPPALASQIRYLLYCTIPHLEDGGDVPPGDYCKIRAVLDRCAEVGEVWGGALTWGFGFGKGGGRARERGWWRTEREGWPDGGAVNSGDILGGGGEMGGWWWEEVR
ncbi:hypothetical protein VE01_03543 [Pseudogymnoascus verrucosus]|uniref:Uncharacterized protein n=1 Tax=Pseudogymnoascus verrucosus TaxID=342668 RepID=A0A1B8GRX9_9PEZI|nr:uncharacterized protein VE01_03543 [Pseudogymnoascus verrucosus]OBT98560.1 hypothetical protein VE01_03543 [Pseudogymnoascus verrucosus]